MSTIKIVSGKNGYHLRVNGMYINQGGAFDTEIRAIKSETGIPYGATEWVSVIALKSFWDKFKPLVVHSVNFPMASVWGHLVPIS